MGKIKGAVTEHMPTLPPREKEETITTKTEELLKRRATAFKYRNIQEYDRLTKEYRASARKDRIMKVRQSVESQLDVRDKWLGIRQIKAKFTPRAFSRRDKKGNPIPSAKLAEASAEYLGMNNGANLKVRKRSSRRDW